MKKFLSLLAIALMAATASAAVGDTFTIGMYNFQIVEEFTPGGDGCVKLTGLTDAGKTFKSFSAGGDAGRVPGEVYNYDGNHYVVSIIGTNAFKYSEAKTICFNYGPKTIEPRAFYSCHNLDTISFPSSVDTLQQNICNFCPKLKYICVNRPTPPACHDKAFKSYINAAGDGDRETLELYLSNSCSTRESISMYRNHAVWGKFGKISTNFNRNSGDFCHVRDGVFTYYYVNALSGNWNYSCTLIGIDHDSSIKNYKAYFPYHTTEIGNHAFQNSTLESIDLSGEYGLTKIGDGAFASCHSLKQVKLPSCVANIGDLAFYDCTSLTGFTVPRDCIELNENWVNGCTSLTDIFVEDGNSEFQAYVGESDYGEAGKYSLLYTGNGKTLYRCPEGASYVQLHHGVETIRWAAFLSCKKILLVRLPYGVKTIRYSAFNECTGLKYIYIPSSVENVDAYAFYDCTSLKYVCLNCSVAPTAFDTSFPQNSNMELVVPDIYGIDAKSHKTKPGFKNFAKYTTNASSCWDFIDADLNRYVVTTHPSGNTPGKAVLSVYVDNGGSIFRTTKYVSNSLTGLSTSSPSYRFELVGIGNHAFNVYEHPKLEWVDLRNSTFLTRIGTSALMGTPGNWSIKYIDLPSNLEVIGTNAFMHCYNLDEVTIPDKVTEIGDSAFYNCSNVKTLTIGKSVEKIGACAFGTGSTLNVTSWIEKDVSTEVTTHATAFMNVPMATSTLTVPARFKLSYANTIPWKYFTKVSYIYDTGDANGDGVVDIADVNICINIILGSKYTSATRTRADVNGDGTVDIADVNAIINIILE